jgi:two-component system, cell cycle response regulator
MALILVVEDDPEINALMALTLRMEDYEVAQARDGEQALRLVREMHPDLILLDVMMPHMSGYDVAYALQDRPSTTYIPIIFVTAKGEMEDRVIGLELAVDYICKPFAAPELLARVRAALRMRKLQEQLRVSNEQLKKLAVTDALTDLSNRRHFDMQLQDELLRARRFDHPVAMVMFDLDHFKNVNDTWGHPQGDDVLQAFAQVLHTSSRHIDTIARLGGEEFGALLPETDEAGMCTFAEKVRLATQALAIPCHTREGKPAPPIHITVSAGCVLVSQLADVGAPMNAVAEAILREADRLLYVAKAAGRNQIAGRALKASDIAHPGLESASEGNGMEGNGLEAETSATAPPHPLQPSDTGA